MEQIARSAFALGALTGWVLLWWFAVSFVLGNRFGMLHWIPVTLCAFGVPMLAADWIATHDLSAASEELFLILWGTLGVVTLTIGVWRSRSIHKASL